MGDGFFLMLIRIWEELFLCRTHSLSFQENPSIISLNPVQICFTFSTNHKWEHFSVAYHICRNCVPGVSWKVPPLLALHKRCKTFLSGIWVTCISSVLSTVTLALCWICYGFCKPLWGKQYNIIILFNLCPTLPRIRSKLVKIDTGKLMQKNLNRKIMC